MHEKVATVDVTPVVNTLVLKPPEETMPLAAAFSEGQALAAQTGDAVQLELVVQTAVEGPAKV